MRPWLKRTLAGLFGAGLLVGGLSAYSQQHGFCHRGPLGDAEASAMRERMIDRATRELGLDDAQRTRLVAVADALKTQRAAFVGGAGADPRAELRSLIASAQFDRTKAQSMLDAKTAAVQSGAPLVLGAVADFWDSLNAEQQAKARDFMARRHGGGWHS